MPSGRLVLFDFKRCWVRVPSHAEPRSLYPWGLTVMNCGYDQSCMILAIFYILFGCLVCEPSKIWFKHDNVFQVQASKLRCYCIWCMTANWEETIAGSTVLRMRTAWTGWNATAAKVCKLLVCHVCQFFWKEPCDVKDVATVLHKFCEVWHYELIPIDVPILSWVWQSCVSLRSSPKFESTCEIHWPVVFSVFNFPSA